MNYLSASTVAAMRVWIATHLKGSPINPERAPDQAVIDTVAAHHPGGLGGFLKSRGTVR